MKKDLDEGKEICFDLLQNSQRNSRQKKKIQRDTKSTKNEENHGCKKNLANSLRAGYASYFKAVFCVRELWQFVI